MGYSFKLAWWLVPHLSDSILPYYDNFAELKSLWQGGGSGVWAVTGGRVGNTAPLGDEAVTNGNMETGNPPTGWTGVGTGPIAGVADERTGGAGVQSISFTNSGAEFNSAFQTITMAAGKIIVVTCWQKKITSNTRLLLTTAGFVDLVDIGGTSVNWSLKTAVLRLIGANCNLLPGNNSGDNGFESRSDDASLRPLVFADCIKLLPPTRADVTVGVDLYADTAYPLGLVLNADAVNPSNCVHVYYNPTTAKLHFDKLVAGTWSEQWTPQVVAVAAGTALKVIKSGTTYQVFVNNIQVSTDQTIAGMTGRQHGVFVSGGTSRLDAFFCL